MVARIEESLTVALARALARVDLQAVLLVVAALAATWPSLVALERLWRSMHDYQHGYMVAAVSVYLLVAGLRRAPSTSAPGRGGVVLLVLAALAWLVGYGANAELAHELAMPLVVLASVHAILGAGVARAVLPAVAYFYFAIPLWEALVPPLQALTVFAAEVGMGLLGVPTYVDGATVAIPEGTFEVVEGCSGKRYFVVALAVAGFAAALDRLPLRRAALLLAGAGALAILANWLRVLVLIVLGHVTNMQHPFITVEHTTFGSVLFAVLIVSILVLGRVLSRGPVTARGPAEAGGGAPRASDGPQHVGAFPMRAALAAGAVLVCVMAGAARLHFAEWPARAPSLPRAPAAWTGPMTPRSDWQPHFVGAAHEWRGAFARGGAIVEGYANAYGAQRQGRELVYFENDVAGGGTWRRRIAGGTAERLRAAVGLEPLVLIVSDGLQRSRVVAFQYRVGRFRTAAGALAQLAYSSQALVGRPAAGVTAFAADCDGQNCDGAREVVTQFWEDMRSGEARGGTGD